MLITIHGLCIVIHVKTVFARIGVFTSKSFKSKYLPDEYINQTSCELCAGSEYPRVERIREE